MLSLHHLAAAVSVALVLSASGSGIAGPQGRGGFQPPETTTTGALLPLYRVEAIVDGGVATAINEAGDVVGWQLVGGVPRAFAYRAGAVTLLPTAADRPLSVARDINDHGVAVGYAYKTMIDEPGNAMRWTLGASGWTVKDLGFLAGDLVSEAKGVNEVGQIVGRSNPRSFLYEHGFLYTDQTGMTRLDAVSTTFVAEDVNDLGIAIGTGYSTAQRVDVNSGAATNLGTLAPYGLSHAYAINNAGQIAGALTTSSGNAQVVARYADSTGWRVLGGVGESNVGWGINSAGTVVGAHWSRSISDPPRGLIFLDSHGSMLNVDDLLEAGAEWTVTSAFDINDAGQIAGLARNHTTGATAAVRLTPVGSVPVPATPSNLTATPFAATMSQEQNRIDLRWQDNAANETGYEVERRPLDGAGLPLGAYARIVTLSANVTSFADVALVLGATYEYRVRATGVAGASAYSNSAAARAPATTPETVSPTVKITTPTSLSTVSRMVTVTISATDNVGVVRVELAVDQGVVVACTAGSPPLYTCKWDTRRWSNGGWTLYARAWDRAGNLGVDAVTVFVSNPRKR